MSQPDTTGSFIRHADVPSRYVAARNVDVWCPPGYATTETRYPVIYMHDGQNLFEAETSYTSIDWGVDEAMLRLIEGGGPPALIVGIWNSPERVREYMPARPLAAPDAAELRARFAEDCGGAPLSNAYLLFLVSELKPLVDASYRTLPDQAHTSIMGSSMGGLISLYALEMYPQIFGGAACLSTHWPIGGDLLVAHLGAALPHAGAHRLYFDYGTAGVDAEYEPYQRLFDDFMHAAGYTAGHDWMSLKFEGADHTERDWRARVDQPLTFLLRP